MNIMKLKHILLSGLLLIGAAACNDDDKPVFQDENKTYDMSGFAKGADVSWLTQMEAEGRKFYTTQGYEKECMELLRDYGINSIRLRVWVNPSDGWCNKSDVLTKAWRAHQLGMRLMIDFHYSDSWADPGQQYKPTAWQGLSLDELKTAMADHTKDVLNGLKDMGITPEWVQVGNETNSGMMWDTDASVSGATYDIPTGSGDYKENWANFAAFISTGCAAVKEVFPDTKVVVHFAKGEDNSTFHWLFENLTANQALYDVIGMSLYPDVEEWKEMTDACIANMKDMATTYGKEVMLCEVGMDWDEADASKAFLTDILTQSEAIPQCLGVFYWEPQSYGGWNGYVMGAFDDEGRPTIALDAFK